MLSFDLLFLQEIIAQKPLHRISYCADDHTDKKIFAFIAKEQQIKSHHCFVVVTEKDVSDHNFILCCYFVF